MEGGATYALDTVRPSYNFDDDVEVALLSLVVSSKGPENSVLKKGSTYSLIYRHLKKAVLSTIEDEVLHMMFMIFDLGRTPFFCELIIIVFNCTSADIDECLTVGICDHDCVNTNGSYKCLCAEGYVFEPPQTCRPQGKFSSQSCRIRFCF